MTTPPMSNKQRLQTILQGGVPDAPPHFELVFQLEREFFGMDREALASRHFSSEAARRQAQLEFEVELRVRLVDELGWAAVDGAFYNPDVDRLESITRTKEAVGDRALIVSFSDSGVYWMPNGEEIMDFIQGVFLRPEEMHAEARRKLAAAQELARQQAAHGADFIIINTDFGFNSGPFIGPAQFQEFVTPYFTELVATIHEQGMRALLHSDGNIALLLEQLHGTGVDGYQSVDPQGHMDIEAVRASYPDWILMGNVPCNLLQDENEAAIRAAVRHCMHHGGVGRRYIFSTSNCIFQGMPPENYRIMVDEYRAIVAEHLAKAESCPALH